MENVYFKIIVEVYYATWMTFFDEGDGIHLDFILGLLVVVVTTAQRKTRRTASICFPDGHSNMKGVIIDLTPLYLDSLYT